MSYEEFLEAVKADAIRMEKVSFDEEEAKTRIEEAWSEMEETSGDKMFSDQYEVLKNADTSFSKGKMDERVYKARVQNAISTAAWNLWMLA